jgi:NAD(P)-dependent dehydrogenase (short-subunit alcohol dehydrogenase family)
LIWIWRGKWTRWRGADVARYLITGAARGIGLALARRLKADGHEVHGLDMARSSDPAAFADFTTGDLSTADGVRAALGAVNGDFDGLCNCAGLPPRDGNGEMVLRVNFFGLRAFTLGLLGQLSEGASIVNLASRAGKDWAANAAQSRRLAALSLDDDIAAWISAEAIDATRAYHLSKEAVILWTFACSEPFLARDVRINSVSPSAVATEILDDFVSAFGPMVARNIERIGRAGTPEEIAEACAFLLSPASGWIRGADMLTDGGMGANALSDALDLPDMRGF